MQELVLASGRVRQSGGTGWSMPPFGQRRWLRADWPGKQQHGIDFMDECGLPGQERGASRSAPVLRRIGNALALVIGGCTALMGLVMIAIAVFGQIGLGRTGAGLTGGALLLIAAPAISLPFSPPLAKKLLLLAMTALALFAGALCFWPQAGATPSPTAQAAVVVFATLLAVRMYLGRRRRRRDDDAGRGLL